MKKQKKEYSTKPIHYSDNCFPYIDKGNKLRSVLCKPITYKYAEIGEEYWNNVEQQRNMYKYIRESYRCIGVFTNDTSQVTCKQCLRKMNPKTLAIKDAKYKLGIVKSRIRNSYETLEKTNKALEEAYLELEKATNKKINRCDECNYYEECNAFIWRCCNPYLGWSALPYFIKQIYWFYKIAEECKCFMKKGI